ncbi:MAG: glycosyltransferase family 9 protein [Flavobacteriales bacterium]|nr:glycosyltransferase family 9 protein [Flavobacteriales bacterium]
MSQTGPTRVLVVRFSSMGDVILTSPVVRALHAMLEGDVEVHFLTKSPFAPAVQGLEGIRKVWTIDRTTAEVESELVEVGFHYVVDLHANARSGFVKRALRQGGTLDLTVDKKSLAKILLVRFGVDRLKGEHVVQRYLDTLRPFGAALEVMAGQGDIGGLLLPAGTTQETGESAPNSAHRPPRIALALGAAHVGKALPKAHWHDVLVHLVQQGWAVDLIGGPDEAQVGAELAASFAEADVDNRCGQEDWGATFDRIGKAALLVVGDTGAMHAGAALQTPMVVLWGCTSPALGMGPWRPHPATRSLEPEGPTRDRPCSRLGDRCRHKVRCPERIAPERIIAAVDAVLNQTRP